MTALASGNRSVLRWLFAIQLISMGAMEMSGPFWPLHLRALGRLSPGELAWASGIAYAGPMIMAMFSTPWWGRIGDRIGHKPMLLRALLALGATQYWIAVSDSVAIILAARLVQGALAGFIAAAQAYGACLVARDKRSALMACLQVATAIGSIVGPMAGGWIFDWQGFRMVNIVATVMCIACTLIAALVLPTAVARPSRKSAAKGTRTACLRGTVSGLLLGIVVVQAGKMMPQSFFGLFAEEVLHTSKWITGLCYGATAVGLGIAAPFWGSRFDNLPRARVLIQVEWICWACALIVAVLAVSRDISVVLIARLFWGIGLAALLPVFYGLLSREADEDNQGQILGAGNGAAKAGALLGASAGSLALAWVPINYIFLPVAALYTLAAITMRIIRGMDDAKNAAT